MNAFERTLDEMRSVKLCCKKIGETSQLQLERMIKIFKNMPRCINFSNFYQNQLYKNTMGVFSKKDWNQEGVNIDVIDQEFQFEWPELMICMKPFLQFYVLDLQEGALPIDEISKWKRKAYDEKLIRFLLLNCGAESLVNTETESTFIIIPPLSDDKMVFYLEDQLQLYLCQVIEYFAAEILKLKNDSSQTVLFNMKEEKINDASKLKKRKQGRQIKIMGDLALIINDTSDAMDYYKQALDILHKNNDNLWCGIIQQNLAAAKVLAEDVEEHFRGALEYLKKTKFISLEIECFFKLMHYRKAQKDKLGLNKTIDLFTKTFDPESPLEKCKFSIFVSELYGATQMKRKQAYYLRLASLQILTINRSLSLELCKMSSSMYGLHSYFSDQQSDIFWPSLQHTFVQEIQHNFQTMQNYILFRPFFQHNTQIQRMQMFKQDFTNTQLLNQLTIVKGDALKQELKQTYLLQVPKIERLQIFPTKDHFSLKDKQFQHDANDIFIVNPWANKENKNELKFPVGSKIEFQLIMTNDYVFDIQMDKLELQVEGCKCITYPKGINIPANTKNFLLSLSLQPLETGILKIFGIHIQYLNYEYIHKLNQYGFSASNPIQQGHTFYDIHNITIVEEIPEVQASVYRDSTIIKDVEAVYFDPSELFTYQFVVKNKSDKQIDNLAFELIIESEDPPIYEFRHSLQNFNLTGYGTHSIQLCDFENANSIQIPKVPHTTKMIRKISLTLFLSYAGSKYQREIKLNRLVSIRERTTIQQCHFVSKYCCQNQNVKEIYDLQDSCFLSIQVAKKDFLISLELQSQILIDGQFQQILNEDDHYYSQALKLRKLPFNELTNPDLKVIWKNLFNGITGVLHPFQHLSQEDICKHCCNDLIEIDCKEANNKNIHYTLKIHQKLTTSSSVHVSLSITNEKANTNNHSCTKSIVSSVKNSNNALIIDGFTSYTLRIQQSAFTIYEGILGFYGQLNQSSLKFVILDKENQRQYIKRCEIR